MLMPAIKSSPVLADDVDGVLSLYPSREDSTSLAFERTEFLDAFESSGTTMTAVRGAVTASTAYGLTEFFSASRTSEVTPQGAVYYRFNGAGPRLFREAPGYKIWAAPGFVRTRDGFTWYSMRLNSRRECSIWMSLCDSRLKVRRERKMIERVGWSYQCYRALRLSDGGIVMPIAYARSRDIYTGPWRVFVYHISPDGKAWRESNSQGYPGRGLMEPQPYLRKDGTVGIFCRTDRGHLAAMTYHPEESRLTDAQPSPFLAPSAGCGILNLPHGRVALAYVPGISLESSYPRKIVALAVTKDDFQSLEAVHVVATSKSLPGDEGPLSFVHQPRIEIRGKSILAYIEQVRSETDISTWRLSQVAGLETMDGACMISCENVPTALAELAELSTFLRGWATEEKMLTAGASVLGPATTKPAITLARDSLGGRARRRVAMPGPQRRWRLPTAFRSH